MIRYNVLLLLLLLIFVTVVQCIENFELDFSVSSVTCRECVEFTKNVDKEATLSCRSHSKLCTGNACFMRQCQNCPVYNYVAGCLKLTEWQLLEIAQARLAAELVISRVGAILLCENSGNQTTCLCNRKDKCNDLYIRVPYTTFKGIYLETCSITAFLSFIFFFCFVHFAEQ
ncbi:unnamed protein product [Enterobius vermicularis]|uniref:Protein quiver n=1 Tax=Enterobius vermicularis TaxID=51028 RepID=A0A0N4VNP9_ENTVE|nr:unnamed protein product [Enterobius vermicularis]